MRNRAVVLSTVLIAILTICLTSLVGIAAATPPSSLAARDFTPQEVDLMVQGYQDQVGLMLQIGAPMVAGLAAAVAFLVHALLRGHRVLVLEVRSGAEERAKLGCALLALTDELHARKCLITGEHHKEYKQ